jgi:hypothetical protein
MSSTSKFRYLQPPSRRSMVPVANDDESEAK